MEYLFTYLIGGVILLSMWLVLFFLRRDVQKEMIVMSSIFGIAGILTGFVYTADWWQPLTITMSRVGIEDFLFGFTVGGIAAVLYEEVFKKKVRLRKIKKKDEALQNKHLHFLLVFVGILFFGSFYLLNINSLYATIISLFPPTIFIWYKRKDLIIDSIATGILLILATSIVYIILNLLTPGWINAFWYFGDVPSVIILGLPIEDVIWYFFTGMFIGPLYEYWKEAKLVDME